MVDAGAVGFGSRPGARGRRKGEAAAVLAVLDARGIDVPDDFDESRSYGAD
jgi:hypothetical protein